MNDLPNELSNIICSYIESPTNHIMKNLYFEPIHCLKLNKKYNFKHINITRLLDAINTKCSYCSNRLKPEEYVHMIKYEVCLKKKLWFKLCFKCFYKEKRMILFHLCELCLMIFIVFYICFSFFYFSYIATLR